MTAAGPVRFHDVIIVGGGCYGTFYARQLTLAREKGKAEFTRLLIVDRDPRCQFVREMGERDDAVLVTSEWNGFFDTYLGSRAAPVASVPPLASVSPVAPVSPVPPVPPVSPVASVPSVAPVASVPPVPPDVIVPSPLMPHLMYQWLERRAVQRWRTRAVSTRPLEAGPGTPYDRLVPDGTRYVSFADWLCPTHCIEPAICPVTRAPRTWEMADALASLTEIMNRQQRTVGPVLLACEHQVFGVGTFSVADVLTGDRVVREAGEAGAAVDVLVGTISSCHGAVNLLHLGSA